MTCGVVVSGIGLPCLFDCLDSITGFVDVTFAFDLVGRSLSELDEVPAELEHRLRLRYPGLVIARNENYDNWQVGNQTLNIGMGTSTCDAVFITHEDCVLGKADYAAAARNACFATGMTFPHLMVCPELPTPRFVPLGPQGKMLEHGRPTGFYSPVSSVLLRSFWEEIGGFDETDGIWYDAQVQEEARRRGRRFLYCGLDPVVHNATLSLRANNWGNEWETAPQWGRFDENYERVYGHPFVREEFWPWVSRSTSPAATVSAR